MTFLAPSERLRSGMLWTLHLLLAPQVDERSYRIESVFTNLDPVTARGRRDGDLETWELGPAMRAHQGHDGMTKAGQPAGARCCVVAKPVLELAQDE
jgi:hypothetical protein